MSRIEPAWRIPGTGGIRAVTNNVRVAFFGGGIHVLVRERLSVFADARLTLGDEAGELLAMAPLRAGLTWRF